jgi:hypothetical protein
VEDIEIAPPDCGTEYVAINQLNSMFAVREIETRMDDCFMGSISASSLSCCYKHIL